MTYTSHRLPDVFSGSDRITVMRTSKIMDVSKTESTTLERTIPLTSGATSHHARGIKRQNFSLG